MDGWKEGDKDFFRRDLGAPFQTFQTLISAEESLEGKDALSHQGAAIKATNKTLGEERKSFETKEAWRMDELIETKVQVQWRR